MFWLARWQPLAARPAPFVVLPFRALSSEMDRLGRAGPSASHFVCRLETEALLRASRLRRLARLPAYLTSIVFLKK